MGVGFSRLFLDDESCVVGEHGVMIYLRIEQSRRLIFEVQERKYSHF